MNCYEIEIYTLNGTIFVHTDAANLFCARGKAADADELRRCNELLKRQTGLFSNFRGTARLVVVTMLAADDAPDDVRLADIEVIDMHAVALGRVGVRRQLPDRGRRHVLCSLRDFHNSANIHKKTRFAGLSRRMTYKILGFRVKPGMTISEPEPP